MAVRWDFALNQELQCQLVMTPQLRQSIELLTYSQEGLEYYLQDQQPSLLSQNHGKVQSYLLREIADPKGTTVTLVEDLEEQVWDLRLDDLRKSYLQYFIYNLDERGRLHLSEAEFCKRFQLRYPSCYGEILKLLQSLEPAGVGARSTSEMLCLQLRRRSSSSLSITLVEKYLEKVAEKDWYWLQEELKVSQEELEEAYQEILECDPFPCGRYALTDVSDYIAPDVVVYLDYDQSDYQVCLSERSKSVLPTSWDDFTMKEGLPSTDHLNWLERALYQSKWTLLQIAKVIVHHQQFYMELGEEGLTPLTMRAVAEELGYHESTVSRAVQGKYMETPRGIVPFRFFFTGRRGDVTTPFLIKREIQKLVEIENPVQPFSDQHIAEMLGKMGIVLSRRTVAKYRLELGIASSSTRKQLYPLAKK
ncbi:RNA polymerase factor sigma-54 [Risungbinella massiliensis]|uniref:RNA polymerase factor sigma-54 n=1 Tax=Risungbinella massiliensis TaxID=1329796 RepID=UPI0005CC5D8C|nr:RNA polymerase factor sigma-54 [Risungbinella massiliensis]